VTGRKPIHAGHDRAIPLITLEQARTLLASIRVAKVTDDGQGGKVETPLRIDLRDRAVCAMRK
jgi:hypothetical protein